MFANKEAWKARLSSILKDNEILLAGAKHAKWLEDEKFENSIWVYLRDVLAENAVAEKHDMSQIIYFKKNFDCARFSNANWNAFLIRNTINRALDTGYNNGFYEKTKNAVINEKVVDDTVDFLLGKSEYQKFASKIRDASDDVKKYANALRLYRHLENLRIFRNYDGFLDNLKDSPSQLSTCTVAPGIRGRFKKDGDHFEGQIIFKDLDIDKRLWNKKDKDLPKLEFYCRYIRDVPSQYYVKRYTNELYKLDDKMQHVQENKIPENNTERYDLTALDNKISFLNKFIKKMNALGETVESRENVIKNMENWSTFPDISNFEKCMNFMDADGYKEVLTSGARCFVYASIDKPSKDEFIKKMGEYVAKIKSLEERKSVHSFWMRLQNLSFDTLPTIIDINDYYFINEELKDKLQNFYNEMDEEHLKMWREFPALYNDVLEALKTVKQEADCWSGYSLSEVAGTRDALENLEKLKQARDELAKDLDKKTQENKLWNTEKEYLAYYFIDKDLGELYSAKKKK